MKITFLVSGSIRSNFSYRPLAMARALRERGHDVSMIAPKADKYNDFKPETISMIDGVRILQPFQFTTKRVEVNLLPYLYGALRLLAKEKPDLVYIYKATPVSVIGLAAKLFRTTEVISDFDDIGSEVMRIEGHPSHQRLLVKWSEDLAKKYSDRLVVASTYLYDTFKRELPAKPMLIVPNGVEADWLDAPIPSRNPHKIVFMGSINRMNILEPLFEVLPNIIATYPTLEVAIVGDGKYLPYFKEKSAAFKLDNVITFMGWLPLEKAKAYLTKGSIGYSYMPDEVTTRAASNMKVPQYMSRGVVPLVTDVGDLRATVLDGAAGYVCKDFPASLQEVLLKALSDSGRDAKARQAIELASSELNWNSLAKNFDTWIHPKKGTGQKIYVVATSVPGDVGGGEIRNYGLLRQLAKQTDASIDLFCISSNDRNAECDEIESKVRVICHIVPGTKPSIFSAMKAVVIDRVPPFMRDFKSSSLSETLKKACEDSMPDILHIEQLHAYYSIRDIIPWLKSKGVKIILDCHNVEWRAFAEVLEVYPFVKRIAGEHVVPHMRALEIEAATESDVVLACSQDDADFFAAYTREVYTIPNGVDCADFEIAPKDEKSAVIFLGGTGYPPNADGMHFYLTQIHPLIQKQVPSVELLAIGVDHEWLTAQGISNESVRPLGYVDDVHPYLNKAMVGICPIRYGSGTRIKILTYMAAGLPVVSTTKGAEGVEYTDGCEIIIADEPQDFADATVKLLQDLSYRTALGNRGHAFILKNYDWNSIGTKLASLYAYGT